MDGTGFTPTHLVPAQGLPFWQEPDPARPPDGRLDPQLPVQVLEQATGWAHVRCSNGWETWVDGRALVVPGAAAPAAPAAPAVPTAPAPSVYPAAPATPGPAAYPAAQPVPGYPAAQAPGAYPVPGAVPGVPAATADPLAIWLPIAGAALAILGGFLPWLTVPGDSSSAWDIPVKNLFDTQSTTEGLDTGPVLLVLVIALIPLFTRQPLPRALTGVLGGVALLIALLGFRLYADISDLAPGIGVGVGLFLTAIGGILLVVGATRKG